MGFARRREPYVLALPAAVAEPEQAGVKPLGGQVDEDGVGWRHFRAPDGNVYELSSG
jgi:hypothetical protein